MQTKFEAEIGRYQLPVFSTTSTLKPSGTKLPPGSRHEFYETHTDKDGNLWWQLWGWKSDAWIVAVSDGIQYATKTDGSPPPSPDEPDAAWRTTLLTEQAKQSWVLGMTREARATIDKRASALQRETAENIIGLIGIQEIPSGSNRGPALSGIVGEYVEHHKISKDKMGTGLAWCALVAQWAQAEAMGLAWATPASWGAHPLKNWLGAAWMQEKEGKRRGIWIPCSSLKGTEILTGAMLIQNRSGSGSDAGSAAIGADGSYSGHTDIVLGWKDANTLWCVGGNLGNTAKLVTRNIRESRCRGLIAVGEKQ